MPLLPGRVCLKFLLLNWRSNRFDLVRNPFGHPDTTQAKAVRDAISYAKGSEAAEVIRKKVRRAEEQVCMTEEEREATDVAETTPYIRERINEHIGLTQAHQFDVTVLKPLFEKRNDYDALIQQYPPDLGFNNLPWGCAEPHMERMIVKFIDEGMSFVIVCNDKMEERKYFKDYIEAFAKACSIPIQAFGGYEFKLDHGVCLMYVLQDVWINMIKHKDKKKNGEDVSDVSIGWKSQDHIIRE